MAELSDKDDVHQERCDDQQTIPGCANSDVKEALDKLVENTPREILNAQENGKNLEADSANDASDFVEVPSETETFQPLPPQGCFKKRMRSVSENESEDDTRARETNRRKFGSEGAILSLCENIIPAEKQKELSDAIQRYIETLIKDSIFKAVKNVAVDDLYETAVNDLSDRKNSLGTESENDFVVEQRLTSDSICELVELQSAADGNDGKRIRHDCPSPDNVGTVNDEEILRNESDDGTFGGYLADLEDTASVDDVKSTEESLSSLNSSISSNLEQKNILRSISQESSGNTDQTEPSRNDSEIIGEGTGTVAATKEDPLSPKEVRVDLQESNVPSDQQNQPSRFAESSAESCEGLKLDLDSGEKTLPPQEKSREQDVSESASDADDNLPPTENFENQDQVISSPEKNDGNVDLILMSTEECPEPKSDTTTDIANPPDLTDNLPEQNVPAEEQMKVNWKVGYLQVKLPHKTRGKAHLKAWKKRRVVIQPDEFVNDPKNPSLVISVYGNDSKKHETTFWHSVSSQRAVVFRSSSRTHRYAFTISDGGDPIIHLSADKETTTQEWMAAIRSVLWPPSPFMELEKMLSGREFEVSIIDNEYSYHAGLLGMYGYMSITPKKLILLHPQQGYVIQEWYLNTVDKFHFVPQPKPEDGHKVLCMTTCSDSSTGQGEIVFFCSEAVTFLQSLASNIHQVLSYHSKQEGGKYRKELEEMAEWLVAPPQDCLAAGDEDQEHYKVPPRQVKSLLDIPNFIFKKNLSPVASAIYPAPDAPIMEPLDASRDKPTTTSHDSGISTCTSGEDFLNCSLTSFVIGGGPMTGKSSDSELSDAYTPPRTPETRKKTRCDVLRKEGKA